MEVLSSVASLGISVRGYDEGVLLELIRQLNPDRIFITEISEAEYKNFTESDFYSSLGKATGASIIPSGVDGKQFDKFREEYIEANLNSPELSIKKNMLDLINDTIYNYLTQYWKGPETINSEVTDSLYRAKHKLFSSVFFELENGSWDEMHRTILDEIKKGKPTDRSVIISTVESRYWFKDHLNLLKE
jgi:hypothetical protein